MADSSTTEAKSSVSVRTGALLGLERTARFKDNKELQILRTTKVTTLVQGSYFERRPIDQKNQKKAKICRDWLHHCQRTQIHEPKLNSFDLAVLNL